jgi:hypothetical protein
MNIPTRPFLLFFIGLLYIPVSATNCFADETTAMREVPTVQLNVFQSSKSIAAPIDGEIILTNLTNKAYDIQSVTVHLPEGLFAIRPGFSKSVGGQLHEIGGKDERIYSFGIPRVTMSFWGSIFSSETLLFVPGRYRLRAEIVLKESGNDKGIRSLYASTEVTLEPPLSAALRGGIVGALLLALFVPAYRTLHVPGKGEGNTQGSLANLVGQFFIYSISGSVVAVTTILFIYRMGSANLPISISVNDYLGGIIIGLFSYVFGDALYKKFFGIKGTGEE